MKRQYIVYSGKFRGYIVKTGETILLWGLNLRDYSGDWRDYSGDWRDSIETIIVETEENSGDRRNYSGDWRDIIIIETEETV